MRDALPLIKFLQTPVDFLAKIELRHHVFHRDIVRKLSNELEDGVLCRHKRIIPQELDLKQGRPSELGPNALFPTTITRNSPLIDPGQGGSEALILISQGRRIGHS